MLRRLPDGLDILGPSGSLRSAALHNTARKLTNLINVLVGSEKFAFGRMDVLCGVLHIPTQGLRS